MRAGTGAAQASTSRRDNIASPRAIIVFIGLTVSKRSAYGTTVTLVNVAVFSVLELPEATARPT